MKIGSGGLQSLIGQELGTVRKIDNVQYRKEERNLFDPGIAKPIENEEELVKAVEQMNKSIDLLNRGLQFTIHEETNRVMVKVYDQETEEVIKEIPPEEFLDMVAKMQETLGLLVDKYV